jgi:uncharacterized Rmd1/YagE family protein
MLSGNEPFLPHPCPHHLIAARMNAPRLRPADMSPGGMTLFGGATAVRARALYIGERIDVRALEQTERLATAPLVLAVGGDRRGVAVLFRYGAVVLFHVPPLEEASFIDQLKKFVGDPLSKPDLEEAEVRLMPDKPEGPESGSIQVAAFSVERLQVIADALARSVALARYENSVGESVSAIETWAKTLEQTGRGASLEKQLRKHLGATLLIQHGMTGRLEITDKPDLLWDRPDLERLYVKLEDEYELKERDKSLE